MPSTDSPGNGWHDEDAPRIDISTFGEMPGSRTLPGPNPERDKRIEVYRDRERRRAARALDRYLQALNHWDGWPAAGDLVRRPVAPSDEVMTVAGERFVEAVGDYVLARLDGVVGEVEAELGPSTARVVSEALHQKAHYGVAPEHVCAKFVPFDPGAPEHGTCGGCGARYEQHRSPDYGVPPADNGPRECPR